MKLLKDGVIYNLQKYNLEIDLEKEVFEHYKEIFGKNTILFNKSKIKTNSNIGTIPDGFIIDIENKKWYVVEVELSHHDIYGHIGPQIMKFLNSIKNPDTKNKLANSFYLEVEKDPYKTALFKINEINEIFKYILDILNDEPLIVVIIDEINDKVKEGIELLENHKIKTIEFKTYIRENSQCSEDHIHLFELINKNNNENNRGYTNLPKKEKLNNDNNNYNNDNHDNDNDNCNNKHYVEEEHLINKSKFIIDTYNNLKNKILTIDKNIKIIPQKRHIAYKINNKNFVDIVLRKSTIDLYLNMKKGELNDIQNITEDVSNVGKWGNGDYRIKINENSNVDINYIFSLIKQSYEHNKNR